jgi:hypothetical protein
MHLACRPTSLQSLFHTVIPAGFAIRHLWKLTKRSTRILYFQNIISVALQSGSSGLRTQRKLSDARGRDAFCVGTMHHVFVSGRPRLRGRARFRRDLHPGETAELRRQSVIVQLRDPDGVLMLLPPLLTRSVWPVGRLVAPGQRPMRFDVRL